MKFKKRIKFEGRSMPRAKQMGGTYQPSTPSIPIGTPPGQHPIEEPLANQIQGNVIGDPSKEKQFWVEQDSDETCTIAAIAAILKSLGITKDGQPIDYDTVLNDVVIRVDAQGRRIGPKPAILLGGKDGLPMYTIQGNDRNSVRLDTFHPGWDAVSIILKHYEVPVHTGYAKHFSTIVKELKAGNKVLAFINGQETWTNEYVSSTQSDTDNLRINRDDEGNFREADHALWITGIDYADPQNPMIVVNDPGQPDGKGKRYPLEQFVASWEDSQFQYTATGTSAPDSALQNQRTDIENRLNSYFSSQSVSETEKERILNTHYFYEYIGTPKWQDKIDAVSPGAKALIVEYLNSLEAEAQQIFTMHGIDPQTIDTAYSNADVSESLIQDRLDQNQNK